MKLIVAIVDEKDVDRVMSTLTRQRVSITRVSSTGGLLSPGNSTLLIGIDEQHVPQVTQLISELASLRKSVVPYTYEGVHPLTGLAEVEVGGFLSFVLDVHHFEQV
ncbi:MAG: cyclic-di-AMP receptor [Anaerolineae bacterium]|nr:cyclic-di-AMP receptor [Anaerolineae bacterium]NUQ02445.1 cyclic-di-AMP receptor [Anaerolineae bacterium]